ncbi:MAG: hypothetical protein R2834_12180 [Rhodothermales bacterium]
MSIRGDLLMPAPTHATQFPGGAVSSYLLPITMGIDWGTSFTKVVLRTAGRAFAVRFDDAALGIDAFLLPSLLHLDDRGRAFHRRRSGGQNLGGLKMELFRLADTGESADENGALAVVYLAGVIRRARTWFLREQAATFRSCRLRWSINLGMPAEDFGNESLVERLFTIVQAAWHLSTQPGPLRVETARYVWRDVVTGHALPGLDCEQVDVLPEIAAQVVGYSHETRARSGLRVLMDIGAMTVDLAGFALFDPEGAERFACYGTQVSHFGVQNLHRNRIRYLLSALEGKPLENETFVRLQMAMRKMEDPGQPVPRSVRPYLSGQLRTLVSAPEHPDGDMAERCRQALHAQLSMLWKQKAMHQRSWKEGLPIFMCGGGCTLPVYQQAVREVSDRWRAFAGVGAFRLFTLAPPADLDAPRLAPAYYHRLSVAYGLSYPAEEISALQIARPEPV